MSDLKTRLAPLLCSPDTMVRDVLARINAVPNYLFQVVVDGELHVLGTVTDGDVRRAMLKGITLDQPVVNAMNHTPILGAVGADAGNHAKAETHLFVPVVNAAGQLVDIISRRRLPEQIACALVMAGGYGKRLGEHTKEIPKPLLPIGERPILDHVLGQLEDAGVPKIYVAVHYRAAQIEAFIAARANRATISLIHEQAPLGTAGALGLLPEPPGGPVLVVNGDLMTRVDFSALREFHQRHSFDGTIGVTLYQVEVPFGVVRAREGGLFAGIDEKPTFRHVVAAGIYYLSPEIVALVAHGQTLDMPALLESAREVGLQIGLFPLHEYWRDIGQPADLHAAEHDHKTDRVR